MYTSYSLPEWQAVKLAFFAPWMRYTLHVHVSALNNNDNWTLDIQLKTNLKLAFQLKTRN